jgi:hypothetical protein
LLTVGTTVGPVGVVPVYSAVVPT